MTSRPLLLLAGLALIAAPARADEALHFGLMGGVGLSQGIIGAQAQVRYQHLAAFAGSGAIFKTTLGTGPLASGDSFGGRGYGGCAGLRGYLSADGEGLFLSALVAFSTQESPGDPLEHFPPTWVHTLAPALSAGWRLRWPVAERFKLALDAGAGAAWVTSVDGARSRGLALDLNIAVGFEY
jgi:hypothetical protein